MYNPAACASGTVEDVPCCIHWRRRCGCLQVSRGGFPGSCPVSPCRAYCCGRPPTASCSCWRCGRHQPYTPSCLLPPSSCLPPTVPPACWLCWVLLVVARLASTDGWRPRTGSLCWLVGGAPTTRLRTTRGWLTDPTTPTEPRHSSDLCWTGPAF